MREEPTEIRDFARQILLGSALEDKLRPAARLSDERPGPGVEAPAAPGRPAGLGLRENKAKIPFPRESQLHQDEARGVVLHFFANHELLALELMALALLRFPDAPQAWRRGLVGVMREEQGHLRLYLDRMAASGVRFGDVPVSAFFWDCLAKVRDPASFLAGMSLTFEQANLDFAAHYAEAFRHVGDEPTAAVLDQVLADEIRHVGHGLRWFDRFREPGELFEVWARALPAPLTPARAKGIGFVRGPRLAAGLDPRTIDRLEVWSASKGRRPTLYRFDPEVDSEVAGLPPTAAGAQIRADLELLPMVLAGPDDAVWVQQAPRTDFLRSLQDAGFSLPERVQSLDDRPWGGVAPWGLSPSVCEALAPAGAPRWEPEWARFYSKAWAAEQRHRWLGALDEAMVAPPEDLGRVCHSAEEVQEEIRRLGRPFVLKAPFSTAGRDRRWAWDARWVERTLAQQGAVLVEPWLEAVADLSFQASAGRLLSWGRFFTDHRGQYRGAWLGPPLQGLPAVVQRACHGDGRDPRQIPRILAAVAERLGAALGDFPSSFGVDALLYRRKGTLRLQPLLEVNPRITMGQIAAALMKRIRPGRPARFDLLPKTKVQPRPITLVGGLITDGVLPLTDPLRARRVVAVLSVGEGVGPDLGAPRREPERRRR